MFKRLKSFMAPPIFEDEQKNRTAHLLNNILIFMIVLFSALLVVRFILDPLTSDNMMIIAGLVILPVSMLFVMRRGHIQLAAHIFTIMSWLAISLLAWLNDGVNDTAFLGYVVVILVASLLVGWRFAFLITGLSIAAGWGLVYGESVGFIDPISPPASSRMIDFTVIFALSGFLVYLLMDGLQRALQKARASNRSLQMLSNELEARVEERTRDLALAAEVGRRITRVHDLDKLLADSVQLIQDRFMLYHVQIYLTDAPKQNLILRASTGVAGRQLLNRGHRLPVYSGSINGTAAFDKKPVLVPNTETDPRFQQNMLLPYTRSEMAIPLIAGDQLLGVLDLQSDQSHALSEDNLPLYDSLAGQLAVAIDNANLLRQTEQAQAELRQNVKLAIREGWTEFLDGIERKKRIGVRYDLNALEEYDGPMIAAAGSQVLQVPIAVANTTIGTIQLEAEDGQEWTEETRALVTAVAQQVGQQAESLRLLTETNRYRNEAEQALRRLRREAWRDYLAEQIEVKTGFVYDQQQVKSLADEEQTSVNGRNSQMIYRPLEVQGEPFGELIVGDTADPNTEALVAAVAGQLSGHLENLRLSAQTEKALAETAEQSMRLAALNEIGRDLSAANDVDETFAVLSRHMASVIPHDFLSFALAKPNGNSAKILAIINGQPVTMFEDQPIAGTVVEVATKQRQLIYLADISKHDYADTNVMAQRGGIRSAMIAPLITARGVLGGIDLMSNKVDGFDAQDQTLLQQIASLVASTLENQRLFTEAQKQAEKERMVNLISQKIQSTVTIESALETAAKELGQALQTTTHVKLNAFTDKIQADHLKAEIGAVKSVNGG